MPTILETARLRLRPLATGDAAPIRAYCNDWGVARNLARVPHPYPDGLADVFIAQQAADAVAGLCHVRVIERDGRLAGLIGLHRQQGGDWELGYWLGRPWWGQGLATEAASRVIAFAFAEVGIPRLASRYHRDNPASGRVLAKCGFRETGRGASSCLARGHDVPAVFVALDAPRPVA